MTTLFRLVAIRGGIAEGLAIAVYAAGFFSMFGFSLAYNMTPPSPLKWLLRRFDHSSIYLMIAGTYTPLLYQLQSRTWAWALAIVVWVGAIAGVVLKVALPGRFDRLSIVVYLMLGWVAAIAAKPLIELVASCDPGPHCRRRAVVFGRDHLLLLAQPEIPERHLACLCCCGGSLSLCRYCWLRCRCGSVRFVFIPIYTVRGFIKIEPMAAVDSRADQSLVADEPQGKADQDRREGRERLCQTKCSRRLCPW